MTHDPAPNKPLRKRSMILVGVGLALTLFVVVVVLPACASMGARPKGTYLEKVKKSASYKKGRFRNSVPTEMMASGSGFRMVKKWVAGDEIRVPDQPPPTERLDPKALANPPADGLLATWLGHATVLLEIEGKRVLTDPVFSHRATPVPGVGPRRFAPPPIAAADLPRIHVVVISHDHYDHLDRQSIVDLAPRTDTFVVPLGVGAHLRAWDVPADKIVELEWGEQTKPVAGLRLMATPARHFSGRGLLDRNKTLWASWVIAGRKHRVYFGGDTGMFPGFADIGRHLGPFHLTLMPVGAYGPDWPTVHLNPEEAVAAHRAVRGDVMLPIHWGMFNLAFHAWTEPAERLMVEAARTNTRVVIPKMGQRFDPSSPPAVERWWPTIPWRRADAHTEKPAPAEPAADPT